MKFLIIAQLMMILSVLQFVHTTTECVYPAGFRHNITYGSHDITLNSRYILPNGNDGIMHGFGTLYEVSDFSLIKKITEAEIDKFGSCDLYTNRDFDYVGYEPVSISSVCPYYFVKTKDVNRIPPVLYEAKCVCRNCIDSIKTSNTCKEVYSYVRVLRRTSCVNGVYEYKSIVEPVATSCGCMRPPKVTTRLAMPM